MSPRLGATRRRARRRSWRIFIKVAIRSQVLIDAVGVCKLLVKSLKVGRVSRTQDRLGTHWVLGSRLHLD